MIVRNFEATDVASANALTNHFIEHTATHFAYAPASDAQFNAAWQSGRERFPWLTAELEGRFAGYAKARTWRDRDAYRHTAETSVYVMPDARRRGVGRALYLELSARLRIAGFRMVVAGMALPNEASVRLHESVGFCKVGVFRAVGHKFGQWHDVGFWQIDLSSPTG